VSLLAAMLVGACAWAIARRVFGEGGPSNPLARHGERSGRVERGRKSDRSGFQVWLSQAGAAVTPRQFWAVSGGVGAAAFLLFVAISRTVVVSALLALAVAATPYAYWSGQRRTQAAARSAAWPDALRFMVGALGAGIATLHDALEDLARSGPEPLRAPMARYVRLSGRLGDRRALETVRADLADPISDPVLLAFEGAVEEGTETLLRVLSDLGSQITADLQLADKIRTLQTQSRAATWGCFALPYVVLVFLCATNRAYREYFSRPFGLGLVLFGAVLSVLGLLAARRLVRPVATTERVFVDEVVPWGR
jgi:Flp pilus assembly protein TadB